MYLFSLAVVGLPPPTPLEMVREAERQRERLGALIRDLDDDRFAVRQKASAGLVEQGEAALPAVLHALRQPASLEVERRLKQAAQEILQSSKGNVVSGLRLTLSAPRLRFRPDEPVVLGLAVRKVEPAAKFFAPLEGVGDRPIRDTTYSLRYAGDPKLAVQMDRSSAEALIEIVQYSGPPPRPAHVFICGSGREERIRVLRDREVGRGPNDVIVSQKVPIERDEHLDLPPGAYSARLVYRAKEVGGREDLASNAVVFVVEPGEIKKPDPGARRKASEAKEGEKKARRLIIREPDAPTPPEEDESNPPR